MNFLRNKIRQLDHLAPISGVTSRYFQVPVSNPQLVGVADPLVAYRCEEADPDEAMILGWGAG